MDGDQDTSAIPAALLALGRGPAKWTAIPADRSRSGDREWTTPVPELGLTLHLERRGREKRREPGGVVATLPPTFLARISDASGAGVLLQGRYRGLRLGDVPLAEAKARALGVAVRELEGMRDALAREASPPPAVGPRERFVLDGVLERLGRSGPEEASRPGWRYRFLVAARRLLDARAAEVVPLAEWLAAAERNRKQTAKEYEETLEGWFASGGDSPTKAVYLGEVWRPEYLEVIPHGETSYPGRILHRGRMEAMVETVPNRDRRPRPESTEADAAGAELRAAQAAMAAAVAPVIAEARKLATRQLDAATALAAIQEAQARTAGTGAPGPVEAVAGPRLR